MAGVEFEFDQGKSEINKAKHGIDFVEAQTLWASKVILLPAKDASEKRIWLSVEFAVITGPR